MGFTISSPDFVNNQSIPRQFTCEGTDKVPTLIWQDPPSKTVSFLLIMDDPDAPGGTWVHWTVFNIPATATKLSAEIPAGSIEGINSWGNIEYGGPCPPTGVHRYFFKLYALDTTINLQRGATKQELEAATQGHILGQTQMIGLYKKQG